MHHVGEQHRDLLVLRRSGGRGDGRTALATELGLRLDFAPQDPHDSPVAVSPPPPSPLGSTSVSFHRWSTMSVISPCHLRHEVLRPSYVVCFETPLVANAPAAKRTLQSRLPVCDFAVAQVDSAARARVPADILRAGPAGFLICVSECAKCARRRRSARLRLRGRRPARNRWRTRCRGSGSSRWTRWVG